MFIYFPVVNEEAVCHVVIYQIVTVEGEGTEKLHRQVKDLTHNYYKKTSCDTVLGLTTH